MRIEHVNFLSEPQNVALDKLITALCLPYVEFLASQGPDVLNERLKAFMQYEMTLVVKVHDQMASSMPTRFVTVPDEGAEPHTVKLDIVPYSGKEGDNIILWIHEVGISY